MAKASQPFSCYSQAKYSGDFNFFFHLVPKMAAPKNGMKKRLLFTLLHSLSHYGPIPLERLKIGELCSPNNKCEKSSKQALKYCLSKLHWAIWFWSNNGDAKCANFVYISAVIAVNFVAFYCLKIIWLSAGAPTGGWRNNGVFTKDRTIFRPFRRA